MAKVLLIETIEKLRQSQDIPANISDTDILVHAQTIDFADEEYSTGELGRKLWSDISLLDELIQEAYQHENTFCATVVIMLYSCIERGFIKLCDIDSLKIEQSVIDVAREFLNIHGYTIDRQNWSELKYIRFLRNTIAHGGLFFPLDYSKGEEVVFESWGNDAVVKAHPQLVSYLKSNEIYMKEIGMISLHHHYCKHVVEFSRSLFLDVESWRNKEQRGKESYS